MLGGILANGILSRTQGCKFDKSGMDGSQHIWSEELFGQQGVLAMTPAAGYIKFVPGAMSLSKALQESNGDPWHCKDSSTQATHRVR